jgi:bifunctional non-homologous end joining protein LigD
MFERLKPLHTDRCPFSDLPNTKTAHWGGGVTADQMSEMQWTDPRIVTQIRFVEWTEDGHLRHASYLGLRSDKSARGVRRESIRAELRPGAPGSDPERRARSASRNSSRRKA